MRPVWNNSAVRTVGIEEELLVVDPETGEPCCRSERVIRRAPWRLESQGSGRTVHGDDEPGGHVGPELQQEQLEVDTPPRTDLDELEKDVRAWRRAASAAAADEGVGIVAAGTSPAPAAPRATPDERYARIMEKFGVTAQEQLACGCHVHVAVEDDDEGVAVLDRIRPWLPSLLALSANSPFCDGRDTGYSSFRYQAWSRWPSAGPTDLFGSPDRYHQLVKEMLATEVIIDDGMVYFDARLSSSYPTVELRTMDVCLDPADAVLVAALCRGLVETAARAWRAGEPAPTTPTALLRLAMWQASKAGADGDLLDPGTGRPRPVREVLDQLVGHVRPALEDAGDLPFVTERLGQVLGRGTGARRQREVMERSGDVAEVVRDLVEASAGR